MYILGLDIGGTKCAVSIWVEYIDLDRYTQPPSYCDR